MKKYLNLFAILLALTTATYLIFATASGIYNPIEWGSFLKVFCIFIISWTWVGISISYLKISRL